ncbi:ParB N-terminal domain-containing protein [Streptomyces rimosus]|uniref:ParB N-terminal domain-containing protein n=1 Tax=Streptomyces rimosus TaxID=1927 RepID=UPI000D1A289F|nr:ParB N-terminal domain-containing protein [Streptomyces rimosus]
MDIPVEEAAVGSVRPGGRDYGSQSSARPSRAIGHGRIETVPVASLILTDTPRTSGTDPEHVLRLAEVKEGLPPILVQRSTLRVLDGMHRVKAAMLRGDDTIPVQYFEGSDAESFVQSVQANVAHGLPRRPVDGAPGRKKAVDIMRERPEAPLRAVAQEAGVSLGTAHNIRAKLRSEAKADVDGPGQERKDTSRKKGASAPPGEATAGAAPRSAEAQQAQRQLLSSLRQDPSVRMTEKGRLLLQWLGILTLDAEGRQQFADSMPAHRLLSVAQLAQDCSATWRQLATELQRAVRRGP